MKKFEICPLIIGIIIFLALPLASATITKTFEANAIKVTDRTNYGEVSLKDRYWLDLFGWFEKDLEDITLIENTESCTENCYAIKEITLYEKTKLVEDVKFETISFDKSRTIGGVNQFAFYIRGDENKLVEDYAWVCTPTGEVLENGTVLKECSNKKVGSHYEYEWVPYNYEEMEEGDYVLKLEGSKDYGKEIDWIIKSQGKWIDEWAVWGDPTTYHHGINLTQYSVGTSQQGMKITANNNFRLLYATFFGNDTAVNATKMRLLLPNLTLIAESDVNVSGSATFNEDFDRDDIFFIVPYNGTTNFNGKFATGQTMPIDNIAFNWTAGYNGAGVNDTTVIYNIGSLTISGINKTEMIINLSAPLNNSKSFYSSLTFSNNVTLYEGELVNSTLYTWSSNGNLFKTNTTTLSGTINSSNLSISGFTSDDFYIWNYYVCASNSTGILCDMFSDNYTVYMNNYHFGFCNSTLTSPFLNITFLDEEEYTNLNSTLYSSWDYYVTGENSGNNKSLSFNNASYNIAYNFCSSNESVSLVVDGLLSYAASGYPQRQYSEQSTLTYITTNRTLYLLSSSVGLYSTYQVQTAAGAPIDDVKIQVERQIGGIWIAVTEGYTDDSGAITFWLNPNYDHRLTFTKLGYISTQKTIKPSSSTYTITMQTTSGAANFTSDIEGIKWTFSPPIGRLNNGINQTFNFNVTASLGNIASCRIELIDEDENILARNFSSVVTAYGCNLSAALNTSLIPYKLFGKYYIDVGGGYFVLDSDAYWISNITDYTSDNTLWTFFNNLRSLDEFGEEDGRQEYSKIVFIFLIIIVLWAFISYSTGWDFQSPGAVVIGLAILFWILSFTGFLRLGNLTPWETTDTYIFATIFSLFAGGYILSTLDKQS